MGHLLIKLAILLSLLWSQVGLSGSGPLFNVTATSSPTQVGITLCLNANGPLSCQTVTVAALNLSITTTVPNHVYPNAGIKINTPGFNIANLGVDCTPNVNTGYCLFSVSDSKPANFVIQKNGGYTIAGSISGLTAGGLVLQNNGGDNLSIFTGANSFAFSTPVASGGSYNVTILAQPTGLTCSVSDGQESNVNNNVNSVVVSCLVVAYVSNSGAGISTCPIINGVFQACAGFLDPTFISTEPAGIALNNTGSIAYVPNFSTNTLSYTISTCPIINGIVQPCTAFADNTLSGPIGIVLNSAGTIAYVTNANKINSEEEYYNLSSCPIINGILQSCTAFFDPTFNSPEGIALNNDETIAFIPNNGNNTISACPIVNGVLQPCTQQFSDLTLKGPDGIVLNNAGTIAYIANVYTNSISSCPIVNGVLQACTPFTDLNSTLNGPQGIALNSAGTMAYIANNNNSTLSSCPIINGVLQPCTALSDQTFNYPSGVTF